MNAIVIEQDEQQTKLAFEVHRNSQLQRIRLARSRVESVAPEELASPLTVSFRFTSKRLDAPAGTLRLLVSFQMIAKPEQTTQVPVRVDASFEADYALAKGFAPTEQHVKAFKSGNAIFNVWPYFREYLQTTLVRMALPPLTAPFLRLQPAPPKKQKAPALSAEKE